MSSHSLHSASGTISSNSTAVVNTIAERDASGNSAFNTLTASVSLVVNGSTYQLTTAKTANFTADTTSTIYTCDTASGSITATLPAVASSTNLHYIFKKTSASNSLIIEPAGAETIDGAANLTDTDDNACLSIYCDGTEWHTISRQGTWA